MKIAPPSPLFVVLLLLFQHVVATASSRDDFFPRNFEEWYAYYHGDDVDDDRRSKTTNDNKNKRDDYNFAQRRLIWNANQDHVNLHNRAYDAGYTSYQKTMKGPFADLTDTEFTESYLMQEVQNCSATHTSSGPIRSLELPHYNHTSSRSAMNKKHLAIDWRTYGILTPIKNQGQCGSCWTFSTSGCLEAHTCLAGARRNKDCTQWTGLAEEQLVDCAGAFNNFGCDGGLPSQAFEYIKYNGGMALEKDYPYRDKQNDNNHHHNQSCQTASLGGWRAQVAEVFNITSMDEDDLVHAIATIGPVSVAYDVASDFRFYHTGIYDAYNHTTNKTNNCPSGPQNVNHAVVAVGLGTNKKTGVDYYIIRNSWSVEWGMEGHFWMKRGENLCGVSDCASFPIVPSVMTTTKTTTTTSDTSSSSSSSSTLRGTAATAAASEE